MPADRSIHPSVWVRVSMANNRRLERRCSDSALDLDRSSNELGRLLYHHFGGSG
jgi:hypothetical protein